MKIDRFREIAVEKMGLFNRQIDKKIEIDRYNI